MRRNIHKIKKRKLQLIFDAEELKYLKLRQGEPEAHINLQNAQNINILPSISAVHDFLHGEPYRVKLLYEDIGKEEPKTNYYPIELEDDDEPGIKFNIIMNEPPNVGGVYHKESYGLHRALILENSFDKLLVPKANVFNFKTRYGFKPQILTGRFRQLLLLKNGSYQNKFNRLIIKTNDLEMLGPENILERSSTHVFDHESFNVYRGIFPIPFRTGGVNTQMRFDNNSYRIYSVGEDLFTIEGLDRQDLNEFQSKAELIRIAFALVSGKYYSGFCNYLTSGDPQFGEIEGICYRYEKEPVISNRRCLDLSVFRMAFDSAGEKSSKIYKKFNRPLGANIFGNLCESLFRSANLRHATELLISGMSNNSALQQGAIYSVSLEAITEELGHVKNKSLKPISDPKIEQDLLKEFFLSLDSKKNQIPAESYRILKTKLENLNTPANQDRLIKTFQLYGLDLSPSDIESIKRRNDFLHGRNPLNRNEQIELDTISMNLHTLIVSLLLKYVGYAGHIINLDIQDFANQEEKVWEAWEQMKAELGESFKRLEKAAESNDEQAFEAARLDAVRLLGESRLTTLVRII